MTPFAQSSKTPAPNPAPAHADAAPESPVSILLVDDDQNNLLALESILDLSDYRLVKAQTADAALLALMQDEYAAIVLDVQMPDLSGIELARLIKQRKRTQHVPIIFLTAHYKESEHAVLGYDVGAVDYLTKPVHPAVLRSKVSVFVDLFRKTRALAKMNSTMEAEISVRKIAEERFRIVVEAAPSAMIVYNGDGRITLVNSEAERLFEQKREKLLKMTISDLITPEPEPSAKNGAEDGAASDRPAREIVVKRRDGVAPAELSITPIQSTEGQRLLASIVDVTERKRAEEALRAANAQLEAKNAALQQQAEERMRRIRAEAAQAEAEAANEAKDRFLAMLSHELRTPLSPVLHTTTLLNEMKDVSSEVRQMLQVIRRNVQLEARLIDDLLDLARIRNGKLQLQLEPTDAHDLLRRALEICQPDIEARGLKVVTRFEAQKSVMEADPARLQQIFWNLISNSVKFTREGGTITLRTEDNLQAQTLLVEVSDTGVGIEPQKLERIFDAFEQVTQEGRTGLGLGLAICRALAGFHGGQITAHSDGLERGATFSVTLPVKNISLPVLQPRSAGLAPTLTVPLRLLVVEDHRDTAAALVRLLVRRGYEVRSAETVASALDIARDFDFDVLITDIGLPDGTGHELFEKLKAQPRGKVLRGLALSGFGMDDDIARSRAAGFTEHLTKPVDFARLQRHLIQIGEE
jgi:PAS domain S-box-containing protein